MKVVHEISPLHYYTSLDNIPEYTLFEHDGEEYLKLKNNAITIACFSLATKKVIHLAKATFIASLTNYPLLVGNYLYHPTEGLYVVIADQDDYWKLLGLFHPFEQLNIAKEPYITKKTKYQPVAITGHYMEEE